MENRKLLAGEQSTRDNVFSALKKLENLAPPATAIIYYSGHGITGRQETSVWLQLSGQDTMAPGKGISLNEVVKTPRELGYTGELVVILDASYSGEGPLAAALKLKNLGEKTLIFSSSTLKQHSQALRLPFGQMSAFHDTVLKGINF